MTVYAHTLQPHSPIPVDVSTGGQPRKWEPVGVLSVCPSFPLAAADPFGIGVDLMVVTATRHM